MASSKRRVSLTIGIAEAKPLDYLQGALNAAHHFHDWAVKVGYDATLLTDDPDPVTMGPAAVTMDRLRTTLEAILATTNTVGPIHRFVIYFAGHGLIREAEEGLWLLSDWDASQRAVGVELLKRKLFMYGISQIAIFADACRSLPPNMNAADLTIDAVLGKGPVAPTAAAVDKYIAAQDGAPAYSIPGESPDEDRCLFTGVLMQALWGLDAAAFSKLVAGKVTSGSLGAYLQSEVPSVATRYNRKLTPTVIPTFPEDDNVYFGDSPKPTPPVFPAWPPLPASAPAPQGPSAGVLDVILKHLPSVGFTPLVGALSGFGITDLLSALKVASGSGPADKEDSDTPFQRQLQQHRRKSTFNFDTSIRVQGAQIKAIWAAESVLPSGVARSEWQIEQAGPSELQQPAPLLVELGDEEFVAVAALPKFNTFILREGRGVSALIYRTDDGDVGATDATEKALGEMESGALRADRVSTLAIELRKHKHADPVLGVLTAYLYDAIGDTEGIRRMAYAYVQHEQPIPYDIALLAQIRGEWRGPDLWAYVPAVPKRAPSSDEERQNAWTYTSTPAVVGVVGGLWPWMRQGWAFLDDPTDVESTLIPPKLLRVRDSLLPARFTTLKREGAISLAEEFGLRRVASGETMAGGGGKTQSAAM